MRSGTFWLRCITPSGSGKYIGFGLRIETEAKRTTIIVDIFDIIQQEVRDTGIRLEVDDEQMADNTRKRAPRSLLVMATTHRCSSYVDSTGELWSRVGHGHINFTGKDMKFCDPLRQEHISVLGPIFGFPLRLAWFLLSNALHGNLFKPGIYLKRERRVVSCTHGIAKFETGALYLTCT